MIMSYKSKTCLTKALFHCPILLAIFAGVLIYGICQKANAEFVISEPEPVPNVNYGLNSTAVKDADNDPEISADGLELYFRSHRPGGHGNWDIWVAKRDSVFHPWKPPVNAGPIANDKYHIEGPSISAGGLELYFSSSRPGALGWGGVDTDCDLWVTKRETRDSPWQTPINLSEINSVYKDLFPSISPNGLELYFMSFRPGGVGGSDIYVSRRDTVSSEWQAPENLQEINYIFVDTHPNISYDGLVLCFASSSARGGYGNWDIWATRRDTINSQWQTPINLGPNVNTSIRESGPSLSADGKMLYFHILYDNHTYGGDIYQVSITPVIDFNGDGEVDSLDLGILDSHLGEEGPDIEYVDIYPSPIGDGKINEKDMEVFLEESSREDRLMAYWKLDVEGSGELVGRGKSIAYDEISGFDGIVYGNPAWLDEGKVNGALLLGGVGDYVELPFVWNPAYGEFSAFAWVNGGDLGQVIISQTDDSLRSHGATWLGIDSLEKKLITGLTDLSRSTECPLVSESEIPENNWNHVGVVWDGARRHLYINGEKAASDSADLRQLLSSGGDLYFGAGRNLNEGSFYNGILDDVKIYAKSLSKEEVEKLYTEGTIAPYTLPLESPAVGSLEDFEAGSLGELWDSYGDGDWSVTSNESYSGAYSARAGNIEDDERSSLEVLLDCADGEVSFYRKVSSESGFDYLRFYINGTKQGEWSGDEDWDRESYSVGEGTHTFTWEYSKDGSVSQGEDTAWVDDVSFPIE